METITTEERTYLGCGFEPRLERDTPYIPRGFEHRVTVCPGYSSRLPEVVEVSRAYVHAAEWGTLRDRFDGLDPTGELLDGLEHLRGSVKALETYIAKPKDQR